MDDSELYDLTNGIIDATTETETIDQQIALLQVQALAALGYQVNRLGVLIEELIEPGPSRWQQVKGWMRIMGWLR